MTESKIEKPFKKEPMRNRNTVTYVMCDETGIEGTDTVITRRSAPVIVGLKPCDFPEGQYNFQSQFELFNPLGMMVWGHDDSSLILSIMVGNDPQIYGEPIPASFFSTGESYEEMEQRVEKDNLPERLKFARTVAYSGNTLRVMTSGFTGKIAVWGKAIA